METVFEQVIDPAQRRYGYAMPGDKEIVDKLIERVGIYCMSGMVSRLLGHDGDGKGYDQDWADAYDEATSDARRYCVELPDGSRFEGNDDERRARIEQIEEQIEQIEGDDEESEARRDNLQEHATELEDAEPEEPEVYQWFLLTSGRCYVSDLQELGEIVLESPYGNDFYWGRQCCGQSVVLDPTFWEMAAKMGILTGQRYSWAEDSK